jgi:ubiquinone/menaquinone biosynthesis C-methylase UbiE
MRRRLVSEPGTASGYFAGMIEEYDSLIRRAVPRYDEMLDRLVRYLPPEPVRVLELGCGTGNLTLKLLQERPGCRLTTVDASPEMVDLTRSRVMECLGDTASLTPVVARFEDLIVDPGSFDLVVSAISLHHVVDKARLFGRMHEALTPAGTFRFSDQLAGASSTNHDINWDVWLEYCRRPDNCSEQEIDSLVEHSRSHDHYVSLEEHFRMLGVAGFSALDCVWRDGMWGVVTADA